jgi:hypothetical protein
MREKKDIEAGLVWLLFKANGTRASLSRRAACTTGQRAVQTNYLAQRRPSYDMMMPWMHFAATGRASWDPAGF